MKLLIDMNLSPQWCGKLQAKGLEAVHWSSIGAPNADDDVLFDLANLNGAIILTHDLGFSAIHAHLGTKAPSVVQIRANEVDPKSLAMSWCARACGARIRPDGWRDHFRGR